jgi:hypothetical protein
LALVELII